MKSAYKFLAYAIAVLVIVQSAAIVFAVAGLAIWVDEGGVFDAAALEDDNLSFSGIAGFMVHGINGMLVIPLLAVVTLIVSFFAKVPGGIRNAAILLGLVILQVALGLFGHESPWSGMLHGINALVLFAAALHTGRQAGKAAEVTEQPSEPATV